MVLSKNQIATGAVLLLLFASPLGSSLAAAENKKGGLKEAGRELEEIGRKVGEAGKEAGREIAGAAKHVFYKGKKASAPLLRDVQRSTREFWREVIAEQDKTIEQLRLENDELKRRLGELDG
ncbi:MAG TPA: hypothetical protein VD788_06740 [Candidatus Polarisedimenticolaceae bacterium]|nr:hypothetical protein [Candidatus Polarisedimenticolaceae bacterium]